MILAQGVASWFADWVTAKQAYHQHSQKPDPESRPDNMFETVDWDEGGHGRFDPEALPSSMQQQLSRHTGLVELGIPSLGAVAGSAWSRRAPSGASAAAAARPDKGQRISAGSEQAEEGDAWSVSPARTARSPHFAAPATRA